LACLAALPEVLGAVQALLADTGYHSEANLERCEAAGIDPYIPEARQRHNPPLAERFADDPPAPAGQSTPAEANAHRLRTRAGKARYAKGEATVETVFGIIKQVQGQPLNSCCVACMQCTASGRWCVWGGISSASLRSEDGKRGQIMRVCENQPQFSAFRPGFVYVF
jgi:hypothetical protein